MFLRPYIHTACTVMRIFVVVFALGGITAAVAQVGLGLNPMRLEIRQAAGGVQTGVLMLSNELDQPVRVRMELLDFHLDQSGLPQFARSLSTESDYSCRQWLTVNPMEAEMEAKTRLPVRYTFRIPSGAAPRSYYCAVGFTTMPTAEAAGFTGLRSAVRLVTIFYVVLGEPSLTGGLESIELERVPGPTPDSIGRRASISVKNGGVYHFRPEGTVSALDENGTVVEEHPLPSLPVLPNRSQRFLVPFGKLSAAGKYKLRARVDIGTQEFQEAVIDVSAEAPAQ